MQRDQIVKLVAAVLLLALAGFGVVRSLHKDSGLSDKAFFYDLSKQELFPGPRQGVPPIKGIDDDEEDAVRAVVISTTGDPDDGSSWKISYLERWSPELKRQYEQAQATGGSPQMGRGMAQAHKFVRRLTDTSWHPMTSDQALRIVGEYLTAGPDGGAAVICTP